LAHLAGPAAPRRVLGDDHPDTLASATALAATLRALGDHATVRTLLEQTLATYRRVLGDDHPDTLRCVEHLVTALRHYGDQPAADALAAEFAHARARRATTS